jgi:ubiquinone/menaquinone biosynthesis C-methylase UbiE
MDNYKEITQCYACGGKNLNLVFDLGSQPLANSYKIRKDDKEEFYPLGINSCGDCHHVQITHLVNPDLLFKDYAYMSGVSKTAVAFFDWFADMSMQYFKKQPKTILDIGCNDGSQLNIYKEKFGLETWGIDPAENLSKITSKNHNIICDYYKQGLTDKQFDIVTVQNAFAHNFDQFKLLQDIKSNLKEDGICFAVTSQAKMLANGEFDTIYHEHISFYNINSMNELCKRVGLNLIDVVMHPIHGTSYIFVISKTRKDESHILKLIEQEKETGLYGQEILDNFKKKAEETARKYKEFIVECKNKKIPVVGYSAPAKSSTFLNYVKEYPKFIFEDTPLKINKYTPGTNIPIHNQFYFDEIDRYPQVCFVIFAWNFYDEIKTKIHKQRRVFKRINKKDIYVRYFPEFNIEYDE